MCVQVAYPELTERVREVVLCSVPNEARLSS